VEEMNLRTVSPPPVEKMLVENACAPPSEWFKLHIAGSDNRSLDTVGVSGYVPIIVRNELKLADRERSFYPDSFVVGVLCRIPKSQF